MLYALGLPLLRLTLLLLLLFGLWELRLLSVAVAFLVVLVSFVFDMLPLRLLTRRFPVPPAASSAVLVTGVSSGLGEAFSRDLAAAGFLVFGTVRKQADADRVKAAGFVHPLILDVTDDDAVPAALDEVKATLAHQGRTLCAVVNNAGITGIDNTIEFAGPQRFERVLATNVVGVARITEAFLPLLKAHGGGARVVNLGSYFGELAPGRPGLAQYVASKFAVEGLSDVWRRDLRNSNIAVALVKPGDFSTNMNPLDGASKDLSKVVSAVRDAVTSPAPLARYHAGNVAAVAQLPVSVLSRLLHVLPDRVADLLIP